ncbi:hypothetical protein KP509_16G065200 [Ceratopteris richardii]|nr:hypothetical protein KP509_16G065200 [Ceratopteris richardii]
MQHMNMVQPQPDVQIDHNVINRMAMQLAVDFHMEGDFLEHFLDAPSSSQVVGLNATHEALTTEMPSWFESSVELLLRSVEPSPSGGRTNLLAPAEGHVSSGPGSHISLIHKRPKVLGSSMNDQIASSKVCHPPSLGFAYNTANQSSAIASPQLSVQDNSTDQQDNSSDRMRQDNSNSEVALGGESSSMYVIEDLLHTVFSFLDQRSLCQAARVCRQWYAASKHEDFWKSLHFGNQITQDQVASVCRRFPRAMELSFKCVQGVEDLARQAVHSLRHLEKLVINKGSLSESFFNMLASGCPHLHFLSIHDVILGTLTSQDVLICHRNLVVLEVTNCRVMRIGVRCTKLEQLSLSHTNMASVTLNCQKLLSLDFSSCMKLSDTGVRLSASHCRGLMALNISQCSYISDETLRDICMECPQLQVLDASLCPNISLQGVRMPVLKKLKLNHCEGITSSSMGALSQCAMLEAITLDACVLLTSVILNLKWLERISLADCYKLVELTLQCPALVDIKVTDCTALMRLDISSESLKSLSLEKQSSLATLTLDCPNLLVLSLVECDSLTNSISEVLSDQGGCPKLNSLTLESCESLTTLCFTSTTLQKLSLTGCQNLVRIELACVNLQCFVLDGCCQLTHVTLAPVGLQSLNLGICPHVTDLKIEGSAMVSVDLRGCGDLSKANIICPQLSSLDASYCSSLDDKCLETATAACPSIQSLILACCPLVGPDGLVSLKKLSNLIILDLSYTFLTDLDPIFESCKRLKVLRLLACKYLKDSALDALQSDETLPELKELDLSYGELSHRALEGVLGNCTYLTHVEVNGCANLGDLVWEIESLESTHNMHDWQCEFQPLDGSAGIFNDASPGCSSFHSSFAVPARVSKTWKRKAAFPHLLQQLNCVGCPNMRRVKILDAVAFQHLSYLNLSLSCNLKEVSIHCLSLSNLNLSQCTALECLQINCPRLISLSLQGSNVTTVELVEGALQGCTSLETLDIRNCSKIFAEDLKDVRAACPRLRRLLSSTS